MKRQETFYWLQKLNMWGISGESGMVRDMTLHEGYGRM